MALFFGTDGLRGEVDKFLSTKIAFRCGNALANVFKEKKCLCVIINHSELSRQGRFLVAQIFILLVFAQLLALVI